MEDGILKEWFAHVRETYLKMSRRLPDESLPKARVAELTELGERLGHSFRDTRLLHRALTHKSFANEQYPGQNPAVADYESLEFLGDAILGFIVSEHIFSRFPELPEGQLTKIRSFIVSTRQLAAISGRLRLGDYLCLSRGEEKTGGRKKQAILADIFESVTAALYLDGGLEPCRSFVLTEFEHLLQRISRNELAVTDYKSTLQETLHRLGRQPPRYEVVDAQGPDHQKEFFVRVSSSENQLAMGRGSSKKEAEQRAAKEALDTLAELESTHSESP